MKINDYSHWGKANNNWLPLISPDFLNRDIYPQKDTIRMIRKRRWRCFLIHKSTLSHAKWVKQTKQYARIAKKSGDLELYGRFIELVNCYKIITRYKRYK